MKKILSLFLAVVMSSMASAAVISLSAYDVGRSNGNLGRSSADHLEKGEVVGLQIVLHHNLYHGFPSYDGYFTNGFSLKLAVSGPGTLSVPYILEGKNWVYDVKIHDDFPARNTKITETPGANPVTNGGKNIDILEADGLLDSGVSGQEVLVWNILFTSEGHGLGTTIALLAGIGGKYSPYSNFQGTDGFGGEFDITDNDLAGLFLHSWVPEPISLTLLALGGVTVMHRLPFSKRSGKM